MENLNTVLEDKYPLGTTPSSEIIAQFPQATLNICVPQDRAACTAPNVVPLKSKPKPTAIPELYLSGDPEEDLEIALAKVRAKLDQPRKAFPYLMAAELGLLSEAVLQFAGNDKAPQVQRDLLNSVHLDYNWTLNSRGDDSRSPIISTQQGAVESITLRLETLIAKVWIALTHRQYALEALDGYRVCELEHADLVAQYAQASGEAKFDLAVALRENADLAGYCCHTILWAEESINEALEGVF